MTTTSEGPQALTKEQRVRITAEATSMSELLGTQADASYSLLLLYEQTVEALEAELAASERATLEEVDNRDKLEDQITAIYYALGGPNEWSNQHDLGVEALAFAHRLTEELEVARSSSLKDSERLDGMTEVLQKQRVIHISRCYVGGALDDEANDGSRYEVIVHGKGARAYDGDPGPYASVREAIDAALSTPALKNQ